MSKQDCRADDDPRGQYGLARAFAEAWCSMNGFPVSQMTSARKIAHILGLSVEGPRKGHAKKAIVEWHLKAITASHNAPTQTEEDCPCGDDRVPVLRPVGHQPARRVTVEAALVYQGAEMSEPHRCCRDEPRCSNCPEATESGLRAALEKLLRAEEKFVRDTGLPQPTDLIQEAVNEARALLGWPLLSL